MKSIILLLSIFSLLYMSNSFTIKNTSLQENKGISFENLNWEKIKAKAKEEKKIIFLDVFASWCGPCKLMKKKTFSDTKVGEYFNTNFINAAFDAELGEGISLSEKYKVNSYPTLFFLKSDGTVLKKVVGYHSPEEILELAKNI